MLGRGCLRTVWLNQNDCRVESSKRGTLVQVRAGVKLGNLYTIKNRHSTRSIRFFQILVVYSCQASYASEGSRYFSRSSKHATQLSSPKRQTGSVHTTGQETGYFVNLSQIRKLTRNFQCGECKSYSHLGKSSEKHGQNLSFWLPSAVYSFLQSRLYAATTPLCATWFAALEHVWQRAQVPHISMRQHLTSPQAAAGCRRLRTLLGIYALRNPTKQTAL